MAKNSPIPSAEEGLVPDRLVSNETVAKRAVQTKKLGKAVVTTPIAAGRGGIRAAKQPISRARQRQSLQKAETRLQKQRGVTAQKQYTPNRANQRQQQREAKLIASHTKTAAKEVKQTTGQAKQTTQQTTGRGMGRG